MNKIDLKIFVLITLISISGIAHSQVTKESISSRIHNMSKLLNDSSGARQVINSSNSEAKQKRQKALKLYQQASEKLNNGANDDATELLNQSAKLMFEAIKISTPISMTEDKNILNYGQRRQSVIALRDAFNRISNENHEEESKLKINKQLKKLITQADALLKNGENAKARTEIDKAYHLLKVSIESIRSGQTLVRSLQFETKEQEYLYEVDRNETHSMLIRLLVDEKNKTDDVKKKVLKFVEEAKLLRQQADAYATEDAYDIAIELLEQSTKQLVRAIRSAGIYIPG
jgi:tetratricopeptide (TPR) repeat protein